MGRSAPWDLWMPSFCKSFGNQQKSHTAQICALDGLLCGSLFSDCKRTIENHCKSFQVFLRDGHRSFALLYLPCSRLRFVPRSRSVCFASRFAARCRSMYSSSALRMTHDAVRSRSASTRSAAQSPSALLTCFGVSTRLSSSWRIPDSRL